MAAGDQILVPYSYEYNGLLMGSGTDYITTKVEGIIGSGDIKTTDYDRMDAWGEYPGRDMMKGKTITFTLDVKGTPDPDGLAPIQDNYDNLISAIGLPDVEPPAPPLPLVYSREWNLVQGLRFYWARPGKQSVISDSDFVTGHFQFVFELKCNDPRSYSLDQHKVSYEIPNTQTSIGGVVTNNGNTAAAPVIIIEGPAINPIISNPGDSGKSMSVGVTLGVTDTLNIDMRQRSILLNGTIDVSASLAIGSQFWKLQPGDNNITYDRQSAGAPSTINILYNDTWSS